MKISLFAILLFLSGKGFAQKMDYKDLRGSVMVLSCGATDSIAVNTSVRNLVSLDTMLIDQNMNMYYEDLAQCYWVLSGGDPGSVYLQQCILNLHKAIHHKPNSVKALWDLSFAYVFNQDCDRGRYYMSLYKQYSRKKYWDKDQENQLFQRCDL